MYKHGNNVCFLSLGLTLKWLAVVFIPSILLLFSYYLFFFYSEWLKSEKDFSEENVREQEVPKNPISLLQFSKIS